jgi:recombination endonuclease VII
MGSDKDWLKNKLAKCPEYKETLRAIQRKYRATHKKERREYERNKRATDPVYRESQETRERNWKRADFYKKRYGITIDDYDRMLTKQDGRCAVCRKATATRLAVDHCHRLNKVRGLLCNGCNSMLAGAKDDPAVLIAGATVLRDFNRNNPLPPRPPFAKPQSDDGLLQGSNGNALSDPLPPYCAVNGDSAFVLVTGGGDQRPVSASSRGA